MHVEHGSLRTFITCKRKNQWSQKSMFHIHNSTIISSLLFFFVFFFRIVLAVKYFYERALVFIKQITKKAFCPCLQTPRCLTSRLASSPVKPFNSSLSIFCSFGSTSTSFKVVFSKFAPKSRTSLSHYYEIVSCIA